MRRTLLALFFVSSLLVAQGQPPCCYDGYRANLLAAQPGLATAFQAIAAHTQMVAASGTRFGGGQTIYRIPVVVHVVWNAPMQNLSNAQVQSQIDVLNEDYRRMNADAANTVASFTGVAADCGIEFCLASVDPNGMPTNGITRTQTGVFGFDPFSDNIKSTAAGGIDPWPAQDYLNIWVGPLVPFGLLGYATPPGTPANIDGVVVAFGQFGRPGIQPIAPGLDQGRTCTHEVGHYLNLLHTWGTTGGCGDDDLVTDTPNCSGPNMGCSLTTSSCGTLDMIQNFLDYTPDNCMNLFTQGQATRMRALFAPGGARVSLLSSPAACQTTPTGPPEYQVNSPVAGLDVNGIVGTTAAPALVTVPSGGTATLTLASVSSGVIWEMGYGVQPLIPASGGAYTTSDGQLVNLDVTDPGFGTWFNGFASPGFTAFSATISPPGPQTVALQMGIFDPTQLSGVSLSQATRVTVQ